MLVAQLCPAPWTVAYQAPLSVEFSRQEYWSGCHSLLQFSLYRATFALPTASTNFHLINLSAKRLLLFLCHTHGRSFAPCFLFIQILNMAKDRQRILNHHQSVSLAWLFNQVKQKSSSLQIHNLFISLWGETCQNTDTRVNGISLMYWNFVCFKDIYFLYYSLFLGNPCWHLVIVASFSKYSSI